MFFPHTYQTRDFAPALAARLSQAARHRRRGAALAGRRARVYTRPVFQGKLSADVSAAGPAPHLVTFQIGAFRADAVSKGARAGPGSCGWMSRSMRRPSGRSRRRRSRKQGRPSTSRRPSGSSRSGAGSKGRSTSRLPRTLAAGARRRARRVAADLRRRLAADGSADRQLRPDRRAAALRRARHLRRHPASRRHEGRHARSWPSTRIRTRRSSRSPTMASPAICSRSCRR